MKRLNRLFFSALLVFGLATAVWSPALADNAPPPTTIVITDTAQLGAPTAIVMQSVNVESTVLGWVLLAQGLGLLLIVGMFAAHNWREQARLRAVLAPLPVRDAEKTAE